MGLFDQYSTADNGKYLRGTDFDKMGKNLTFIGVEKIIASNPKMGAVATDYLYKQKILEEGETFEYSFLDEETDEVKIYTSKSATFFIAMKQCNPDANDKLHIYREGERDKTRYFVSLV